MTTSARPLIDDSRRAALAVDGYTILEGVFTPDEMARTIALVEALEARNSDTTSGITHAGIATFTSHLAEQDPEIAAFAKHPRIVEIATAILGPDVDLYWNQSVFKKPEGNRIFPWHQDDAYTPVEPAGYLTLWLALTDATPENGCISVLPGSHKGGLRPHERTEYGLAGHPADHPDQGVLAPVKAGSVVVFSSLTLHKSGPNVSKEERKALVLQYAAKGLRLGATGETIPDLIPVARSGEPV